MRVPSLYLLLALGTIAEAVAVLPHDRGQLEPKSFEAIIEKRQSGSDGVPDSGILNNLPPGVIRCPPQWSWIARELRDQFLTDGQCNSFARAAIRTGFHDCGTWERSMGSSGGCDGSLALAEELSRSENSGVRSSVTQLAQLAKQHKVGVADMIQFAAAVAVKACPMGPIIQTFVGRADAKTPSPPGLLPPDDIGGDALVALFADKGFDVRELVALLGAHSVAKTTLASSVPGLDSTPGTLDVKYYNETLYETAPFLLPSDKNLAAVPTAHRVYKNFADNQRGWAFAFSRAMTKLSLLGVDRRKLADCTIALLAV
ncbi:heme peroxidase [Eremomyces bilateralis CBS 781.70]|uniref:Peroxidase n=1 Tax=Eremomyces bilateralis CBS 781.70 TaxID=1392243 RepID=A0A6G1G4W4_9PEZI|nr:heme peroxidase [Eremomyces bilateralis CBS 781.70]KAF1813135.1 heme peroxidase [Eremomyces bilateralis CBS 781.70]